MLPTQPSDVGKPTGDRPRHGTTTLFAALETATEHVTGAGAKRKHRVPEFLWFLRQIDRVDPDQKPHLIMSSYATDP